MFLKRITIVGFKSFANKTVLNLEPGMTAVVGPNGSGKSNIADAIRWALGEQSKSRLRLGDREEVVFAGSDKRARASLAEVVLLFDNEAGKFPLDLTEVEISRRLYRSGESEYRLAGRAVKLSDLQQLLAEAGFGVGSYAVIGQGMIDSLLLSSPAERKLLFDEAAGIRGAELSREASVRKLAATETNLVRLRDIAAELAPRAASLERATEAAAEQDRLQTRLEGLRATLVASVTAEASERLDGIAAELGRLEHHHHQLRHDLKQYHHEQAAQLATAAHTEQAASTHQAAVARLEQERDDAVRQLGAAEAQLADARREEHSTAELKRRATTLERTIGKLKAEQADAVEALAANKTSSKRATAAIESAATVVAAAQAELLEIREQLTGGMRHEYVGHALSLLKAIALQLDAPTPNTAEVRLLVHKAGRLLSHASRSGEAELAARLKSAQAGLEAAMAKREIAAEHQTNVTLTRRSIELDQVRQNQELEHATSELASITAKLDMAEAHHHEVITRKAAVAAAETNLAAITEQLETERHAASSAVVTPAEAIASVAAMIERLGAEASASSERIANLRAARTETARRARHYQQLGRQWGVGAAEPNKTVSVDDQETTLDRLEGELEARIQLNAGVKIEYDEVTTRQAELTAQIADLEAAKADLITMVERLGVVVQERFQANFARLSTEFARQAERLFGGGTASLDLAEDDDGQYGIVIKVSPKGKRLASLAALSGGERALAGVALLAAILAVNPSPFVVLDEIDAALDDANSGRLADIMGELAERSQLIVITHNRQTMKAARILFGVTINEHHVSHLISLHLEQATELAAR